MIDTRPKSQGEKAWILLGRFIEHMGEDAERTEWDGTVICMICERKRYEHDGTYKIDHAPDCLIENAREVWKAGP